MPDGICDFCPDIANVWTEIPKSGQTCENPFKHRAMPDRNPEVCSSFSRCRPNTRNSSQTRSSRNKHSDLLSKLPDFRSDIFLCRTTTQKNRQTAQIPSCFSTFRTDKRRFSAPCRSTGPSSREGCSQFQPSRLCRRLVQRAGTDFAAKESRCSAEMELGPEYKPGPMSHTKERLRASPQAGHDVVATANREALMECLCRDLYLVR